MKENRNINYSLKKKTESLQSDLKKTKRSESLQTNQGRFRQLPNQGFCDLSKENPLHKKMKTLSELSKEPISARILGEN
jgi:hypothetical protein